MAATTQSSSTTVQDLEAGSQERLRLLSEPLPRSDARPSSSSSAEVQHPEQPQAEESTSGQEQTAARQEPPAIANNGTNSGRRSGFSWDLLSPPYQNPSWLKLLQLSNSLSFLVLLFLNVATNSEALWPAIKTADAKHPPVLTPAGWTYSIRDFIFFFFGCAVACQNVEERKGWKDEILGVTGFSWQVIWYADCIWLVLYATGTPVGLLLAPLFCLSAALAALSTMVRINRMLPDLHSEMQAEGWDGVPGVAYLLYIYPTSLAAGWHLLLFCHATIAGLSVLTDSRPVLVTVGCLLLAAATFVAMTVLMRCRDALFGVGYVFGCIGIMIGVDSNNELRPDQLLASFCAGIGQVGVAMLLYVVVSVQPQQRGM